ncbi:hypothetical protein K474DRAFT_1669365, partial [Panus rudis PR-1116 ss-1]
MSEHPRGLPSVASSLAATSIAATFALTSYSLPSHVMRPTSILFHRELEEKLELLQDLEFDDDSRWMQDCSVPEAGVTLAYADEDAFDDCDACVYDPGLFPPSSPHRSYIVRPDMACTRDKVSVVCAACRLCAANLSFFSRVNRPSLPFGPSNVWICARAFFGLFFPRLGRSRPQVTH